MIFQARPHREAVAMTSGAQGSSQAGEKTVFRTLARAREMASKEANGGATSRPWRLGKLALEPPNLTMIHTGVRNTRRRIAKSGPRAESWTAVRRTKHCLRQKTATRRRVLPKARLRRAPVGPLKGAIPWEAILPSLLLRMCHVVPQIGYASKGNYCFRLKLKLGRHESVQDEQVPRTPDGSDAATCQKTWLARRRGRGLLVLRTHTTYTVITHTRYVVLVCPPCPGLGETQARGCNKQAMLLYPANADALI
jgi:hypothetical protein